MTPTGARNHAGASDAQRRTNAEGVQYSRRLYSAVFGRNEQTNVCSFLLMTPTGARNHAGASDAQRRTNAEGVQYSRRLYSAVFGRNEQTNVCSFLLMGELYY